MEPEQCQWILASKWMFVIGSKNPNWQVTLAMKCLYLEKIVLPLIQILGTEKHKTQTSKTISSVCLFFLFCLFSVRGTFIMSVFFQCDATSVTVLQWRVEVWGEGRRERREWGNVTPVDLRSAPSPTPMNTAMASTSSPETPNRKHVKSVSVWYSCTTGLGHIR